MSRPLGTLPRGVSSRRFAEPKKWRGLADSPAKGRNRNSDSIPHRQAARNWNNDYRSCPGSRATLARYRRSAGRSCGSRLSFGDKSYEAGRRGERQSSPAVLPRSGGRCGSSNGDGIKERWSGLHFPSGDTSEPTSHLARACSRATSLGRRKV